eukprot:COSAG02_NODE_9825_length_2099_cov_8.286000_1_plen_240_part_00
MNESGRDRDSQMIPGAVVLSSFRDGERSTAAGSVDGRRRVLLHRSFFPESLVLAAIRLSEQLMVPVLLHHPDTHAESGQGISCCGDPEACHPEHVHEYVNADEWPWATAPRDLSAAQAALVLSSTNRMHVYSGYDRLVASAPTSRIWKLQLFVTAVSATAEEVARRLEALPELQRCTVLRQTHFVELVPPCTNKAIVSSELRHACPPSTCAVLEFVVSIPTVSCCAGTVGRGCKCSQIV